ncbi:MAG: hypothetical protein M3T56_09600 [Chloroflexota bacterium]|nr:hypothetical protein [Chloroflexota bacterium]
MTAERIETCIAGPFSGWSGETAFDLCNGQVWGQVEYAYLYQYAYRPNVVLELSGSGWTLSVQGVRHTIRVRQVDDFVRSCIDGTFDGWTGDTTFELANGQVWKQDRYAYLYHYAYRPSVLIYLAPSGGYRMLVEGLTETLPVSLVR